MKKTATSGVERQRQHEIPRQWSALHRLQIPTFSPPLATNRRHPGTRDGLPLLAIGRLDTLLSFLAETSKLTFRQSGSQLNLGGKRVLYHKEFIEGDARETWTRADVFLETFVGDHPIEVCSCPKDGNSDDEVGASAKAWQNARNEVVGNFLQRRIRARGKSRRV